MGSDQTVMFAPGTTSSTPLHVNRAEVGFSVRWAPEEVCAGAPCTRGGHMYKYINTHRSSTSLITHTWPGDGDVQVGL